MPARKTNLRNKPLTDAQRDKLAAHVGFIGSQASRQAKRLPITYEEAFSHAAFGCVKCASDFDKGDYINRLMRRSNWGIMDGLRTENHVRCGKSFKRYGVDRTIIVDWSLACNADTFDDPHARFISANMPESPGRPDEKAIQRDSFEAMIRKLTLNIEERMILRMRFVDEMTLKDIGDAMGISESRTSQLVSALLERGRSVFEHRKHEVGGEKVKKPVHWHHQKKAKVA